MRTINGRGKSLRSTFPGLRPMNAAFCAHWNYDFRLTEPAGNNPELFLLSGLREHPTSTLAQSNQVDATHTRK